ncbi:hypothetical protein [Methylobacterium sp. J-077]|uniref:hypothetical protein n=1 Tax=Methylobacterium sp. J-077 TaxID=2836656 RepID=UPI001FBB5E84|nr:hypothetical protein [Methylobacterium sp. J-077]MCJ2122982.1 hypothetical protein [Methylobacterium sp. J-077]
MMLACLGARAHGVPQSPAPESWPAMAVKWSFLPKAQVLRKKRMNITALQNQFLSLSGRKNNEC